MLATGFSKRTLWVRPIALFIKKPIFAENLPISFHQ
jgi:hypothetical protein